MRSCVSGLPDNYWEARAFSDQILDLLPMLVMIKDAKTRRYVRVNAAAQRFLGMIESQIIGKTAFDIFNYADSTLDDDEDAACLSSVNAERVREMCLTTRGSERWFMVKRTVLKDYYGKDKYIIITYDDVTAMKLAKTELKDAKTFIENLLTSLPIPVFWYNSDHVYLGCNGKFSEMLGLRSDEIIGKSIYNLYPAEKANELVAQDELVFQLKKTSVQQVQVFSSVQHELRDIIYHKNPIFDRDGNVIGLIGVSMDITELLRQKKLTNALIEALDNTSDAIVLTNEFNRIIYVNRELERLFGYSKNELIGKKPSIFKSGKHDDAFYKHMWKTLKAGKPWTDMIISKASDGTLIESMMTIIPIMNGKIEPIYYLGIKHKNVRVIQDSGGGKT